VLKGRSTHKTYTTGSSPFVTHQEGITTPGLCSTSWELVRSASSCLENVLSSLRKSFAGRSTSCAKLHRPLLQLQLTKNTKQTYRLLLLNRYTTDEFIFKVLNKWFWIPKMFYKRLAIFFFRWIDFSFQLLHFICIYNYPPKGTLLFFLF